MQQQNNPSYLWLQETCAHCDCLNTSLTLFSRLYVSYYWLFNDVEDTFLCIVELFLLNSVYLIFNSLILKSEMLYKSCTYFAHAPRNSKIWFRPAQWHACQRIFMSCKTPLSYSKVSHRLGLWMHKPHHTCGIQVLAWDHTFLFLIYLPLLREIQNLVSLDGWPSASWNSRQNIFAFLARTPPVITQNLFHYWNQTRHWTL